MVKRIFVYTSVVYKNIFIDFPNGLIRILFRKKKKNKRTRKRVFNLKKEVKYNAAGEA